MLVQYKTKMGIETTKKDWEDFWDSQNKPLNVPPLFLTCDSHPPWHFNDAWYPSYDDEERMILLCGTEAWLPRCDRPEHHLAIGQGITWQRLGLHISANIKRSCRRRVRCQKLLECR